MNCFVFRKSIALNKDTLVCGSLESALDKLNWPPYRDEIEQVFVIGGSQIYDLALQSDALQYIYLTKIYADLECDTFFKLDSNLFSENELSQIQKTTSSDSVQCEYQYFQLEKKSQHTEQKSDDAQLS